MRHKRTRRMIALLLVFAFLMCGCADGPEGFFQNLFGRKSNSGSSSNAGTSSQTTTASEAKGPYIAPAFLDSSFHADKAEGKKNAKIDTSAVSEGYVAVSATSTKRLKFQVIFGDKTYNYNLSNDGTPSIFPLQSGDGTYKFRVVENTSGSKYAEVYTTVADVKMKDQFQPFLRPNDYVNYSKDSECVKKAAELAKDAGDALGLIGAVYEYVCKNVTYDKQKAKDVQSGYLPDPDETMRTGKGICFDYASLAGAMLRSQGIPCKEIFGYVAPNDLYHAWNMFYTEQTGWVVVSFEVKAGTWNRLDLTFSANGSNAEFIGNGENYSDLYSY